MKLPELRSRITRRVAALLLAVAFCGCGTPHFPASRADVVARPRAGDYAAQHAELWTCAVYGFCGYIHYVGSDRQFDYFRVGGRRGFFRLLKQSSALADSLRFEVGKGKPFTVGSSASPAWTPAIPHP